MITAARPVLLTCLLANLSGPPNFQIDGLNFQLYPINKLLCPGIDPIRDVAFEFHISPSQVEILKMDPNSKLSLNFTKPTMIFFHGFLESSSSTDSTLIRDAYLERGDTNIIIANTRRLVAGPAFLTAVQNAFAIGQYTAKFIDFLVARGLELKKLHLIGMSLGGQIVGITGSLVKSGKVGRITGLDPAGPIFSFAPENLRLDKNDAEFVDVIHSDAGVFGFARECGHVDVWINGGKATQPGCQPREIFGRKSGIAEQIFCNHWRSYQLYVESVNNVNLTATKCDSWNKFLKGDCIKDQNVPLGFSIPLNVQGNYYIRTTFPY